MNSQLFRRLASCADLTAIANKIIIMKAARFTIPTRSAAFLAAALLAGFCAIAPSALAGGPLLMVSTESTLPARLALPGAETPKPEIDIAFQAESQVPGANYTLGDVAEVKTPSPKETARLKALVLGKSPQVGTSMPLSARQIASVLDNKGYGRENANLRFPKSMTLERTGNTVDRQAVKDAVEKEIRAHLGDAASGCVIGELQLPRNVVLPSGQIAWNIELRMPQKNTGAGAFVVEPSVDGVPQPRFTGSFRLDMNVDVLQAAGPIARGDVLRMSALRSAPAALSGVRGKPLTESDLKDSLTAKRALAPGEVLTWENVERRVLVKNGQTVRMELSSAGGMCISTQGQAKMSGALGDNIEVLNVSSGAKVRAVVSGPQTVTVPF